VPKPYVYDFEDLEEEVVSPPEKTEEEIFLEAKSKIIKSYNNEVSGVYMITNIREDKIYVGSSSDINGRWLVHKLELKFGRHHNKQLQNDYYEFGEGNFTFAILWEAGDDRSRNFIYKKEQEFIEKLAPEYNAKKVHLAKTDYNPKQVVKNKRDFIERKKAVKNTEECIKAFNYVLKFIKHSKLKVKNLSNNEVKIFKGEKSLVFNSSTFVLKISGREEKIDFKSKSVILAICKYFDINVQFSDRGGAYITTKNTDHA
jgi:group I intron endonuclease